MKPFVVHTIVFGLLLTACAGQSAGAESQEQPDFSVEVKNNDDQISILYEQDTAVIEIKSPSGNYAGYANSRIPPPSNETSASEIIAV